MDGLEFGELRGLEERSERPDAAGSRMLTIALSAIVGVAVILGGLLAVKPSSATREDKVDPLAELASRRSAPVDAEKGSGGDRVTFPTMLSDAASPSAPLELLRTKGGLSGAPAAPPPAADRLAVVPLPAQMLDPSGISTAATDPLTVTARSVTQDDRQEGAAGAPGGYQLQISSFRKAEQAQEFASALRKRGHRAWVEQADLSDRGTYHRVKVGPFENRHLAVIYRQEFEMKERIVPLVLDPPAVAQRRAVTD